MAFESLTDQIKERAQEAWGKIESSQTYSNLREKYETLSPNSQKLLNYGAIALVLFMIASVPYTYLSDSSAANQSFNKHRSLIRNLLRASRLASEASSVPPSMSAEDLKVRVQGDLTSYALLPEQLGGVIDLDKEAMGGALAPASILQTGVGVSLKKLNLKQITDIGFQLQNINPSVKMAGIEVSATAANAHYFDVLYKLVIFSLPQLPSTNNSAPNFKAPSGNTNNINSSDQVGGDASTDDAIDSNSEEIDSGEE